ncbi:MAG: dipeptidyl carboxypeptidase II, partial [Oleiagrimonas sp.]|nr:dipeptidyl carboxypeptidase II [Oleiagrimonas sp.]
MPSIRRLTLASMVTALVAVAGCSSSNTPSASTAGTAPSSTPAPAGSSAPMKRENPLLSKSDLPFQAPPFDQIKDSDFEPAFKQGMADQLQQVQKIADNPA